MSEKPRKKTKITKRQREARRENIARFNRARGGQPALCHGINVVLRSGGSEMPPVPSAQEIAERVDGIIAAMVSDQGCTNEVELPAQRRALIHSERMCLLILGLADSYIRREGLLDRRGRPHPLLKVVATYANSLRLAATTLGLERRPKNIGPVTLEQYLNEKPGNSSDGSETVKQ
jgi:hypothetical protein